MNQYHMTQKELNILDGLNTSKPVLIAIQLLTGSRFVLNDEINEQSLAYKTWDDPSNVWTSKCPFLSKKRVSYNLEQDILETALEIAIAKSIYENKEIEEITLCWGTFQQTFKL